MIPPQAGMTGWIVDHNPYRTKEGLPDRTPVTVTAGRGQFVTVLDPAGKEWEVFFWQVDCGREFESIAHRGTWIHESDPRVLDWMEREVAKPIVARSNIGANNIKRSFEDLRWILRRNGRNA